MLHDNNVKGNEWIILLKDRKSTCDIDLAFKPTGNVNVIMGYRAENWKACNHESTKYTCVNQDAKFMFWSSKPKPFGKNISLNCYLFRTCLVGNRASLIDPGNTYKLKEGKR